MEAFESFVGALNGILWGPIMLVVLVGTGIFFSFRTRFVQVRRFGAAMKRVFGGFSLQGAKAGKDGMSSFQALTTAIAAQVGTGNIAGCATAIVSGGPGAIFWMWLSAFFGMSTIYAEAVLAQKTKTRDEDGQVIGGPAYYIRAAFSGAFGKFLAGVFSVAIILALGFMGNMVQSNSISEAFSTAFGAPKAVMGVICALIAGFIFIGGLSRIASFTEKVVPIMAILYIIGSLILIIIHIGNLPGAIASIFIGAFSPQALGGAAVGLTVKAAVRFGIARGLFSNEAGMGSTPHAHALARVEHPAEQGETAMVGVFIDTFVVLNMTALVILTSGVYEPLGDLTGTALAQKAFESGFGTFGNMFVAVCLLFFAFSTIIGWYFFGKQNVTDLFGARAVMPYSIIVVICILIGSMLKVTLVWDMSDMFNGLMVIPNLIGVLALNGIVAAEAGRFDKK